MRVGIRQLVAVREARRWNEDSGAGVQFQAGADRERWKARIGCEEHEASAAAHETQSARPVALVLCEIGEPGTRQPGFDLERRDRGGESRGKQPVGFGVSG